MRNVAALIVLASSSALATPPSDPTPGARILKVDAERGIVIIDRERVEGSDPEEPGVKVREIIVRHIVANKDDVIELCRAPGDKPSCIPKDAPIAEEQKALATIDVGAHVVASLLVAEEASGKSGAQSIHKKPSSEATHAGHAIVMKAALIGGEDAAESGFGQSELWVDIDGERRFRIDASWTLAMGGRPNAWVQMHCGARACLVIGGYANNTGRGNERGLSISAPFVLDGKKLDAAALHAACGKNKPNVTVVANAALVASEGERWSAALRAAGCHPAKVERAKAERAASVVYAKDVTDAGALALAALLGAKVEPLTWSSSSPWVLALGGA